MREKESYSCLIPTIVNDAILDKEELKKVAEKGIFFEYKIKINIWI